MKATIKRFVVFGGVKRGTEQPGTVNGGWYDMVDSCETPAAAKNRAKQVKRSLHWVHVVDLTDGRIIYGDDGEGFRHEWFGGGM